MFKVARRNVGIHAVGLTFSLMTFTLSPATSASAAASTSNSTFSTSNPTISERESIANQGYYVKKNLLSSSQIDSILIDLSSQMIDKTVFGNEISKGRYHYNMLPSKKFTNGKEIQYLISDVILPISLVEMGILPTDIMMTTLQIVDSLPGSSIQIWHADNAEKGITVIIPLVDLTPENGPTEFISGSHNLLKNISAGNISVVRPMLAAGDGLVVDARVLHRGGANLSNKSRPILVIRFDHMKTQPPCMSVIGATARLYLAKFIVLALEIFPPLIDKG